MTDAVEHIITPRERVHMKMTAIARSHGVTLEEMKSSSRFRVLVMARTEAYRYLREVEHWSFPRIAEYFHRDHGTVIYALSAPLRERKRERRLAIVARA